MKPEVDLRILMSKKGATNKIWRCFSEDIDSIIIGRMTHGTRRPVHGNPQETSVLTPL